MLHPFNFRFDEDEHDDGTGWYYRAMLALSLVILLFAVLTLGAPSRAQNGAQPVILLAEIQAAGEDGPLEEYAPVGVWLPESPLYSCFVGSSQCCVISHTLDGAVITSQTAPDACNRVAPAIPLIPYAEDLALERFAAPVTAGEGG
jgi:hypothetical protein